jgi:hypothetical protein
MCRCLWSNSLLGISPRGHTNFKWQSLFLFLLWVARPAQLQQDLTWSWTQQAESEKPCWFSLVRSQITFVLFSWYPECLKPEQVFCLTWIPSWASLLCKFCVIVYHYPYLSTVKASEIWIEFFLQLQLIKLYYTTSIILNHPSSKERKVLSSILNRFFIFQLSPYFIIFK